MIISLFKWSISVVQVVRDNKWFAYVNFVLLKWGSLVVQVVRDENWLIKTNLAGLNEIV